MQIPSALFVKVLSEGNGIDCSSFRGRGRADLLRGAQGVPDGRQLLIDAGQLVFPGFQLSPQL